MRGARFGRCASEWRTATCSVAHTDGYPPPPPLSYDAADADPADPDETKFSDDEEEAKFMRREQEVVKQRAQQTAAQVRWLDVRTRGAWRLCASHWS